MSLVTFCYTSRSLRAFYVFMLGVPIDGNSYPPSISPKLRKGNDDDRPRYRHISVLGGSHLQGSTEAMLKLSPRLCQPLAASHPALKASIRTVATIWFHARTRASRLSNTCIYAALHQPTSSLLRFRPQKSPLPQVAAAALDVIVITNGVRSPIRQTPRASCFTVRVSGCGNPLRLGSRKQGRRSDSVAISARRAVTEGAKVRVGMRMPNRMRGCGSGGYYYYDGDGGVWVAGCWA